MAFSFWKALSYLDDVIEIGRAFAEYGDTRSETQLTDRVTKQLLKLAYEEFGDAGGVDEELLRQGLVMVVAAIEPLFGTD